MTINAEVNYPIQWSEGMLIAPQHFQQNDIYWEKMLHFKTEAIQPNYWGVSYITLQQRDRENGIITIEKLQAIMPDGLPISYDVDKDSASLNINYAEAEPEEGKKTAFVYLRVPKRRDGAASQKSEIKRYSSIAEEQGCIDENTGESRLIVERLKPILSLSFERKPARYAAFPLFKIDFPATGSPYIAKYVPPLLSIGALRDLDAPLELYSCLDKLAKLIRHQANALAGEALTENDKEVANKVSKEMGAAVKSHFINERVARTIDRLVCYLPELELLCNSPSVHPFEVYKVLAAITGSVTAIGGKIIPPKLPKYIHNNIAHGFMTAIDYIETVVDEIDLSYSSVTLIPNGEACFTISLNNKWLQKGMYIEFFTKQGGDKGGLLQWVESAKIASENMLYVLTSRRLPGAKTSRREVEQNIGLTEKSNSVIFKLDNNTVITDNKKEWVMQPDKPLIIKGMASEYSPLAVILHLEN